MSACDVKGARKQGSECIVAHGACALCECVRALRVSACDAARVRARLCG